MSTAHGVRVEHLLGRGGNGEVWRGHHLGLDRPVALKWLWRGGVGDLRREARTLADLDHPHVVGVHDLWVPTEAPPNLLGRPCLMMALAEAGDAAGVAGHLRWPDLAPLISGALAGLGHVAARGHLHLDLKPANLLLAVHERRVRACLSDFGLGRAQSHGSGSGPLAGTPRFRPPEAEHQGPVGPASDIYSLGATLWALVTGLAPPLEGPLPPVAGCGAVGPGSATAPAGIDGLIARATHRDPLQRYGSAQEMWIALSNLGDADLTATVDLDAVTRARATRLGQGQVGTQTLAASTQAVMAPLSLDENRFSNQQVAVCTPAPRPVLSVRSLPPAEPQWTGLDVFAGAGLARARRPRIEGRSAERGALWQALHRASQGLGPAVCTLVAPPGAGASRLCGWLVEQARLTGAVAVAAFEGDGPFTAAEGLGRVAAALNLPTDAGDPRRLAAELTARLRLAETPTLLVVLDPPESAPALVRWLASALDLSPPPRLMVLLTGSETKGLPSAPGVRVAEDLRLRAGAQEVVLRPLARAEVVALVRQRVAVASAVAEQVAERAAGLPGHALALIAHAAERGVLVPSAAGLVPAEGRALRLPADLAAAWRAQVRAVLGRAAAAERLLAAMALWGGTLTPALRAALATRGARLSEPQVEALADRGLLRVGRTGLTLRQRALGEALWQAQLARGRGSNLALRVAEAVAQTADPARPTPPGHLAQLWRLAGQTDRAIETLVARAPDLFEALDAPETAALARELAAVATSPAAQATCLAVEARALYAAGQNEAALARLAEIDPAALASAPLVARLEVAQVRLLAALSAGQVQVAAGRVSELVALAATVPDPALALEARSSAARVEIVAGKYTAALEHLGDLNELSGAPPRLKVRAWLLKVEALMHRGQPGDLAHAAEVGEVALGDAERLGDGSLGAQAMNNLGDVRTRLGDFDGAMALFERAIEIGGDRFPLAAYPHANCVHIHLLRGEFEAARQRCERVLDRLGASPPPRLLLLLGGMLLHALAATHRPAAFDTCAEAVEAVLGVTDVTFIEARLGAEGAAAAFEAAGDAARAQRSSNLAQILRDRETAH